jgi:glutathione peroxidase
MRRLTATLVVFATILTTSLAMTAAAHAETAHDFEFVSIEGDPLPMRDFAGKAILLVNTASMCGFTPQYEQLQALWEGYRDRGLVVLGVPSDNFGGQEYQDNAEIKRFCDVQFGIDFPMTEREDVTGRTAHPLFAWIAAQLDRNAEPRWNFHKFLIAPDGRVVEGFPTTTRPDAAPVIAAIERVLPQAE